MMIKTKKAALEMSIGTVVVIVLGMSMLILGLVLVRNIFSGATENVQSINDKVREQIGDLFGEDSNKKSVVFLSDGKAEIKQGDNWGLVLAIKNVNTQTSEPSDFSYEIKVSDSYSESDCKGLSAEKAQGWIVSRRTGSAQILPGETEEFLARISVPQTAPLCIVPYDIEILENGEFYDNNFFDVVVK